MTFSVRVRLTTREAGTESSATSELWLDDPDLKALAILCNADPLISADQYGYVLGASELDALEEAPIDDLLVAAELLLDRINGAAQLLLDYTNPAHLTGQIQTSKKQMARGAPIVYRVHSPRDLNALHPKSCAAILAASDRDPSLVDVLMLLGHPKPGFTWFDLWHVWEALRQRAKSHQDFRVWVGNAQACLDFERSANDPAVSGPSARHKTWEPRGKAKDPKTGLAIGQPMSPSDAREFIHTLVRRWIEEDAGQQLVFERRYSKKRRRGGLRALVV